MESGLVLRKQVKSVNISNYERRQMNSYTRVVFEDDDEFLFAEFNLDPNAIIGLEIEFNPADPVYSLRCKQPYSYILKSNGLTISLLKSIQNDYDVSTPTELENFIKSYLAKLLKEETTPKIKRLTAITKRRWKTIIDSIYGQNLFLPFSLKYELYDYIISNIMGELKDKLNDFDKDWVFNIHNNLDKGSFRYDFLPHHEFTSILDRIMNSSPYNFGFVTALLSRLENKIYRDISCYQNGDRSKKDIAKIYNIHDKSNMYVPIYLEKDTVDYSSPTSYFKSVIPSKFTRYDYFNDKSSMLSEEIFIKTPYMKGALVFELLISGLNIEQVIYFLKNINKFEEYSPYGFTDTFSEDGGDKKVNYTHKEIELLIKKTGFNKGFVMIDSINSFIKEQINEYTKESIYINTMDFRRNKKPFYFDKKYNRFVSEKNQNCDVFYEYSCTMNKTYSNFLNSVKNNIDMVGFLQVVSPDKTFSSLAENDFIKLLEEYLMKNTKHFITESYDTIKDDIRIILNKGNFTSKPTIDAPSFQRIGLVSNDEMEKIIHKQVIIGSKQKDALKDDGNFDIWINEQEKNIGFAFTEEQRTALKRAYTIPRLFILSGYAGTGKSTITKSIVARFKEVGFENAIGCSLAGVAANRLGTLTGLESMTLHSLLNYTGGDTFLAPAVLNYDLVVLDEASMIDTKLFKELISRIDFNKTSLLIIGDDAQLPPIGKGSPFADIVTAIDYKYIDIPSAILTKVQRSAGKIVQTANFIRSGEHEEIADKLYDKDNKDIVVVQDSINYITEDKSYIRKRVDIKHSMIDENLGYDIYKNTTFGEKDKSENILINKIFGLFDNFCKTSGKYDEKRFKEIQIISPTRANNRFAVKNLNKELQSHIREDNDSYIRVGRDHRFYKGDKVIHIQNSDMEGYVKYDEGVEGGTKIYNGQIGIISEIDFKNETLTVYYDANRQTVTYDVAKANELIELAYVLTAHKVQGNEFDTVVNIIPFVKANIGRKYLYSSFTRAKKQLYILGKREYFDHALEKEPIRRNTKTLKLFKDKSE